MKDGDESLGSH